jgi:hypothetical protein
VKQREAISGASSRLPMVKVEERIIALLLFEKANGHRSLLSVHHSG